MIQKAKEVLKKGFNPSLLSEMKLRKYLWIILPVLFAGFYLFVPLKIPGLEPEVYLNGIESFKYLNEKAVGGILASFVLVGGTIGKAFDID